MEYAYAREIARRLETELKARGIDAVRITPEEYDVPLSERCRRANKYGSKGVLLVFHPLQRGRRGRKVARCPRVGGIRFKERLAEKQDTRPLLD